MESTQETPQAGENQAAAQAEAAKATESKATEAKQKTTDEYEQMIADLRKENAERRTKLKDFETAEATRKQAEMTEAEKAKARIAELEEQNKVTARKALDADIRAHAASKNFADPSDAIALIDREKIDEEGKNIPDLLDRLLKAKPHLAKDPKAIPSTTSNSPGGGAEKAHEKAKEDELRKTFPSLNRG